MTFVRVLAWFAATYMPVAATAAAAVACCVSIAFCRAYTAVRLSIPACHLNGTELSTDGQASNTSSFQSACYYFLACWREKRGSAPAFLLPVLATHFARSQ